TGGDAQLLLDEINAVDQLGHRMLDLKARVHLQEEELARVGRGDELDRAGARVATRAREGDGRLAHARPQRLRYDGRGGLLDDLLVAALQRALALAEVHDVAVAVAEDLHFDVARALDPLLDDDA